MRRIVAVLTILLLVLAPSTYAFNVQFTEEKNDIFKNETATYTMRLTNTNGFNDSYTLSTRDPSYIVDTDPSISTVRSYTADSYTVKIRPKRSVDTGPAAVPVKIRSSETGKFIDENLLLNIKPRTPFGGEYAPSIDMTVRVPEIVDPRDNVPVTVDLDNKNPRDMPNLSLDVRSQFTTRTFTVDMPPLGQRTKNIILESPRDQRPGIYDVTVQLVEENVTVSETVQEFEIRGYRDVERSIDRSSNFFKLTRRYTYENAGNVPAEVTESISVPWYKKLFTDFSKQSDDNTWAKTLQPGESFRLTATYNYRPLVFAILIILAAIAAYYLFRSAVTVQKEAIVLEDTEMKVRLTVHNRGRERVEDVTVMDKVPNMADFIKREQPGTLSPDKVVSSEAKGTSLQWQLDNLDVDEERIIQYTIESKLEVVGGLKLPPSKIKYHTDGKQRSSLSSSVTVVE